MLHFKPSFIPVVLVVVLLLNALSFHIQLTYSLIVYCYINEICSFMCICKTRRHMLICYDLKCKETSSSLLLVVTVNF